ncbi:hypothetical protein CANARDRAFT_6199 [[Candida] arabinofermentans NRRL YB-2248]|uniref:non-specific serine/threonine protein kinase n=1 Tax=[Candida] arabinofermentans NRRL YB-2248 TaxID=983967 RepID=A0A1E4T4F3_9ASCO|nr:hypothetical protein CANARDRAFT_6199 [[Candida] arabinofermentans NRRL YB-2248]
MSYKLSQLAPLPQLKNVEIGSTIGHGGFGMVKSAVVKKNNTTKVIAVKFVHIQMAKQQNVSTDMLAREAFIQKECHHRNIIQLIDFGADKNWVWMAMELGDNGELFDKIEPDLGVDEDVAQFYFIQLINAVSFIHSKGVAHRDIKPENLVLDKNGNLKLTDFGLASVFKKRNGPKRLCTTACGSPPYLAPEVVTQSYDPEVSDLWSCAIVLFVLLTGKIAWEMPHEDDADFKHFIKNKGDVLIDPWNQIPIGALSLLRKILNPNPENRISMNEIKTQPWVAKKNRFINDSGMCKDPLQLTARLLVNLYINISDQEFNKVNQMATQASNVAAGSQPMLYLMDDMHRNTIYKENYQVLKGFSSSQEVYTEHSKRKKLKKEPSENELTFNLISKDPAALQFISGSSIKSRESKISDKMKQLQDQQSRYPELFAENFTRFFSIAPLDQLIITILEALNKLGYRNDSSDNDTVVNNLLDNDSTTGIVTIPIHGKDSSNNAFAGNIRVVKMSDNLNARKIEFNKIRSDPLEWRRVFKKVTILCRDVIYVEQLN